ncbi:MAG: substrate-binding domain-containing protein [Oscillospiraceae bacterium]
MKKLVSFVLALALCLGCLTACGGNKQAEGSKLIGVCMQNKSSSISVLQEEALVEMFEPLGYDVQVASADDSASTQKAQLENFILMGAEMIVVLPCEIEVLEDSLLAAREAGIKVVISGGTGTISEDAYDAVSSDDEYMIGMYVASVCKTWVEEHMDPSGDWEVAFLSSTVSEDAKLRCQGEAQILEPWLKNARGEYVTLMGEVVDEANRVENPVYCETIASRVSSYDDCNTEMDISGDNRTVVAGVLTENSKVRVLIAYNSLASVAGSQYVMDTYPEAEQEEFAFFSGGVMGNEYDYLIGAVSDAAGTKSVFRGACQFGGGDAAGTLAKLCYNVMFGEAGKDYGKANPNSIGLYFPVDAALNGGTAALVCFDTPSYVESYTYEEILSRDDLMTYWDAVNGYNPDMQESAAGAGGAVAGGPIEGGAAYLSVQAGIGGDETHEIDLMDDGTCKFFLPGSDMITDIYAGTYSIAADGVTVTITGLTNVDSASPYPMPGLWSYIDGATGNASITIDPVAFTYTAEGAEGAGPAGDAAAPGAGSGAYTYEFDGMMGKETAQFDLAADGTCQFSLPGNPVITDVYAGTYTREGDTVSIVGLTNVDASSEYKTPGLWDWIVDGNTAITVDDAAGTFAPAK